MYVPFNQLPNTSRVWIYMSNTPLSDLEEKNIQDKLQSFCEKWTQHKNDLKTSFLIKYKHFIVIAVDESYQAISGCGINKSIKLIQKIEQELSIELMNRLLTGFIDDDTVKIVPLSTFKEYIKSKKITKNTVVFNNLAATKLAFEKEWEVSINNSWHARFLN